jgi:hypothetical protein
MLNMVDEDNIPSMYSGSNTTCPDYAPECGISTKLLAPMFITHGLEDMTSVIVGPGKLHTVEVNASAGSQVHWNFSTEKHDIIFRVNFEDVDDLVEPCRVDSHLCVQKGTLFCQKTGIYNLVFDNTYSSFTGKTLKYITWTS